MEVEHLACAFQTNMTEKVKRQLFLSLPSVNVYQSHSTNVIGWMVTRNHGRNTCVGGTRASFCTCPVHMGCIGKPRKMGVCIFIYIYILYIYIYTYNYYRLYSSHNYLHVGEPSYSEGTEVMPSEHLANSTVQWAWSTPNPQTMLNYVIQ